MPVVKMPNGDQVSFPDEMPKEQIRDLIASKFPESVPKPESKGTYRGQILPYEHNMDTGEVSFAVPRLIQGLYDSAARAVTAPGRAYRGELQVMGPDGNVSPEAIEEGVNFAAWMSPAAPGSAVAKGARVAPQPKPLTEGQKVAHAGERLGVQLPRAVTSDSVAAQQMGKITSNVPLAGTPLRKASEKAVEQLDDAARGVQSRLGTGERAVAGASVREGVEAYAKGTLGGRIAQLEDDVAKAVNPDVITPLTKTRQLAAQITAGRKEGALAGEGKAVSLVSDAISREGMTFNGIRTLRTSIREMLDNPSLIPADISKAELKRVYSSLTDDLRAAAQNAGGKEGLAKFDLANRTEALIARDREALQRIMGRNASDEKIADNLLAMAGNTSRANIKDLMLAKKAVSKETWDELSSAALAKMGRDAEGNFTPDRFLTAWGKMNPSSKKLLFPGEVGKSLDDIATVSSRFKRLNQFANPSGTGQTGIGAAYLSGMFLDPTTVIGSIVGTNALARYMARPQVVKEVASYSKAYELAARMPSPAAQKHLAERARSLALVVANDNPTLAAQMQSSLAGVKKVAGQDEGVGGEGAEIDQGGKPYRPRQLAPFET
jgi:hypothetical protein